MAPSKISSKKVVKIPGNTSKENKLQRKSSLVLVNKRASHHDELPSETVSTVTRKPMILTLRSLGSAVLPENTPASQRNRTVHVKRLTDVFTKLPNHTTLTAIKNVAPDRNISQSSRAKQNDDVSHNVSSNNNSADVENNPTGAEIEQNVEMEQGEPIQPTSNNALQRTSNRKKHQQRNIKFFFYPVEDSEKWIKDEKAKSKPPKKHRTKKLRAAATDEPTEVMLWSGPSRKRNLRDLTDLEVALTVFKHSVEEFSECVSDGDVLMLIKKFKEHFERSVMEKLQSIEDVQRMQQEINKLKKENKALSLNLGSLIRDKIKLQDEIVKRRVARQE